MVTFLLIITVISAICFTACSQGKITLEKYCKENPEVQESVHEAVNGSNVVVEIKDNDLIYTFDLSNVEGYNEEIINNEEIKDSLESALLSASPTFGNISKSLEESTNIQGIRTTVNYSFGDEVLITKTFTSADAYTAESEGE